MDFLRKHYEKLILVIFLAAVLVWSWLLLGTMKGTNEKIDKIRLTIDKGVKDIAPVKPIDVSKFKDSDSLLKQDGKVEWTALPEGSSLAFLLPPKIKPCKNKACINLLTVGVKECPYCLTVQEEVKAPVVPLNDDTDKDGLSDEYEKKYPTILNANDANDANEDPDKDLFTNLEEYKAGTNPTDPKIHPALALKLRFLRMLRNRLPFTLDRVTRSGEDTKQWDLQFTLLEGGRTKTVFSKISETIGGYSVIDIEPKKVSRLDPTTKETVEVDQSLVKLQKEGEEPYLMAPKQIVNERSEKVELLFLRDLNSQRNCQVISTTLGAEVTLTAPSGDAETYILRQVKDHEAVVRLVKNENAPDIRVPALDARRDFLMKRPVPASGGTEPAAPATP